MNTGKIRTIVRDKQFEQEITKILRTVERADEFLEGAERVLSRQPEVGSQLGESNVWFLPGYKIELAIYYTFDEDFVYLLSVQKIDLPEEL